MNQLVIQAPSLRAWLKTMLPSSECKHVSESDCCTLSIQSLTVVNDRGEEEQQNVLYGETSQPSFSMALQLPLTSPDVEAGNVAVRITTRELDNALASFGQKTIRLMLIPEGGILLTTIPQLDAEGVPMAAPTRTFKVRGEAVEFVALPEPPSDTFAQLPDPAVFIDALGSCVGIAAVRGNGLKKSGVTLTCTPDALIVEGRNSDVVAQAHHDAPWTVAPAETHTMVLSTDTVRHLIAALRTCSHAQPVTLAHEADMLVIQTDCVCMKCD